MPEPTHSFETYTPQQAKNALGKNEVNRNLRTQQVDKYARDMANGNWGMCVAPIVFDEEGKLRDGQHRLTAQVKANVKIKWLILRNVPTGANDTIDTGAVRSVADVLHFKGDTNTGLLAAITRNVHRILNGMMAGGTTISHSEIIKTLDEHPEIRRSVEIASQARNKTMTPIAPSVLGAAHWMIAQENGYADADIFLWRVIHLTQERDGSPVLALARRCNEIKRQQQRVQHRDYLAMVIKAWNLDAKNKTAVKIATYSKTGQYVLPEVIKRDVSLAEAMDLLDNHEAEAGEQEEASDGDDGS